MKRITRFIPESVGAFPPRVGVTEFELRLAAEGPVLTPIGHAAGTPIRCPFSYFGGPAVWHTATTDWGNRRTESDVVAIQRTRPPHSLIQWWLWMDEKLITQRGTGAFGRDDGEQSSSVGPALIAVFGGGRPCWLVLPLPQPTGDLELGRDNLGVQVGDGRISRRHVRVSFCNGAFSATDLGSLNGTLIDGQSALPHTPRTVERCIRIGDTLLLPCHDVRIAELGPPMVRDGFVIGPRLSKTYARIARHAKASGTLNITGESGTGKENAARVFHAEGESGSGPFVAVNCATIPEGIAERLLFGAKRGAFSGAATDSDGYVQSAHNGTLFLDEIAELSAAVQAKLLRVLETHEVLAVGAVKPQRVNLRVVSASHRSLYSEVAAGRLREDLYYRIGRPSEQIPALRDRPEEIPWLVLQELQKNRQNLSAHVAFVEACVLRPWPGNVRELLVEVRTAMQEAIAEDQPKVRAEHLAKEAGLVIRTEPTLANPAPDRMTPKGSDRPPEGIEKADGERPSRAQLIAAILEANQNLSAVARQLGLHRTQLRRYLDYYGIDVEQLRALSKK